MGHVKAITLLAALELGRRRKGGELRQKKQITCSNDAAEEYQFKLSELKHEEFWVLLLNRANRIIDSRQISRGGISGTLVDPKLIFSEALAVKACALILCHNHPSGNSKPSEADIQLTKKLREGGKNLEISILDHVIIAGNGYFSFADEGLL
jgi:DNA repair protein RadC